MANRKNVRDLATNVKIQLYTDEKNIHFIACGA